MGGVEQGPVEHREIAGERSGDPCPQVVHTTCALGRAVSAPKLRPTACVAATTRSLAPPTSSGRWHRPPRTCAPPRSGSGGTRLSVLLAYGDADDTGEVCLGVSQVVVVDIRSVGVPATDVFVGAGAGKHKNIGRVGGAVGLVGLDYAGITRVCDRVITRRSEVKIKNSLLVLLWGSRNGITLRHVHSVM